MNKVIRMFLDVDMRNQHSGLINLAASKKVNLRELARGEHVVFINNPCNRVKVFSHGNILTYLWREKGRIDIQAFSEIAGAFNDDGSINFDKALKDSLIKRLEKKRGQPTQ